MSAGRPRRPIPHGTSAGYRAHYRRGEPMCNACRDAERTRRGRAPRRLAPCGTRSAYHRHLRYGEECAVCREANTLGCRDARARRQRAGLPADDPRHGSTNAYANFGCRCQRCSVANARKSAERRAQVRGRAQISTP